MSESKAEPKVAKVSDLDKAKAKLKAVRKLLNGSPTEFKRTGLLRKQTELQNEVISLSKK